MAAVYEATWTGSGGVDVDAARRRAVDCGTCPLRPLYCVRCSVGVLDDGAECVPDAPGALSRGAVAIPAR